MSPTKDNLCVVLLSMGGPDTIADVREYLYNIFSDRSIIRLPGGSLFQKPLARLISLLRRSRVEDNYRQIGGGSPLLNWTHAQARQIENILSSEYPGIRCCVGMRYFRPTIDTAVSTAYDDGYRRFCFLPMYPQYSRATTGSSFAVARKALATRDDASASSVNDFHDDAGYIRLLREYIEANIAADETLLFSAHSLPQRFVDEGDPYVDQVRSAAAMAAGEREYFLSFQSRTGPMKWVGPNSIAEARRLLAAPRRKLFVVPLSFVCDNIETLHEIDIDLKEQLGPDAEGRLRRMPMFNDDPRFASVLADIVRRNVRVHGAH